MSASSLVASRLNHLAKASQLLATTSPAISGHLRSAQHRLATGEGKPTSSPSHLRTCSACGSSLVLGWNCKINMNKIPKTKRTRQDRLQKRDGNRTIDVRCSRCDSITKIESIKPSSVDGREPERKLPVTVHVSKPSVPRSQSLEVPKIENSGTAPAAPAVKKRSRNKKSSLQSMLDNRKLTGPTKGFGLGLADFMTG